MAVVTPDPDVLLSTVELSRILHSHGGACHSHRMTVNRWCAKGLTVCGTRVKLKAMRQGGRWLVRWADFLVFRERCTALAGGELDHIETPTERRRRAEKAGKDIDNLLAQMFPNRRKKATATSTTQASS